MNPFPPPRAYVDWKVPLSSDGTPMLKIGNAEGYNRYIEWLADYLYEQDIPVPACQENLYGFPCFVPDEFAPDAFDNLERMIGEGIDYPTYFKTCTEDWEVYFKDLRDDFGPDSEKAEESGNKKYYFDVCVATEEQFNRVVRELEEREAKGVPETVAHADIPYRAVFARTLKGMALHEERVRALHRFYDSLNKQLVEVFGK